MDPESTDAAILPTGLGAAPSASAPVAVAPHTTYTALVASDDDMIGHVAYALYKRDKLHFCDSLRAEQHRHPTKDEIATFIRASNLPTRVKAYREAAERLLERFAEVALEVTIADIESQKNQELLDKLSKAKSWPKAVGENLLANLLAIAVVALLAVMLYGTRIGFFPLIGEIFGYDVIERSDNRPAEQAKPTNTLHPPR